MYRRSGRTYGSPRVYRALGKRGIRCSKERVERLMREDGLRVKKKRRWRGTTDSSHSRPERGCLREALRCLPDSGLLGTDHRTTSAESRGNRQANAALYRIVIVRLRWHQPTIDYVARRTAEGLTKKEIIRCLKRYVAREVFRLLPRSTQQDSQDLAHAA